MYIIPDDVLNQLLCSICFRYLSVKPVKIYKNKAIKCGRCSEAKDEGIVSLYEKIVGKGVFPCINRYEGCTQLLPYSEVAIHEKECKSTGYTCPICQEDCTSYYFVRHYEKEHPEAVLKKPQLLLTNEKGYEKYYMYKESDFIYIFYVRCNLIDNCFCVNVACLGPPEKVHKIKQYLKCYLGDAVNADQLFLETKERYCSLLDNNAESFKLPVNGNHSITISFFIDKSAVNFVKYRTDNRISDSSITFVGLDKDPQFYVSEAFSKIFEGYYLSSCGTKIMYKDNTNTEKVALTSICYFCKNNFSIFDSVLFECKDKNKSGQHFYCRTCYSIERNCLHAGIGRYKIELCIKTKIMYSWLQFNCKWNCGSVYSRLYIRDHEDRCKNNVYAGVSLKVLVAINFNMFLENEKTHLISTSNLFSFDQYGFQNGETIFVITRYNFKFVLHSKYENNVFHFWVSHNYPKNYYYNIQFKIREESYNEKQYINSLVLDNYDNKIIKNVWGFAVVLNKKV